MAVAAGGGSPRPRPFLGVERSVCGRMWRDRLDERGVAQALSITQKHGVPELLARILAGRNVAIDSVPEYLDPSLRALMPDPYVLADMEKATLRLADAIERRETIAIFGDYDVDGATSAAVLARYLRWVGLEPLIHIPDRLFEGYGPNIAAVDALADRGATLLITVDCGTTSPDALARAAARGMDTIVIDHHQADEQLPPAVAVVNPNRLDDLSQLNALAAVGLVFLATVAVNRELRRRGFWTAPRREPDLLGLLDLVALGTVADVAPLVGLNRAFVAKGLLAMRRRQNVGLTALMDVARLAGPPEPWHLGFLLGPRINAGGRIGRADLGTLLLLEDDPARAGAIAAELDRLNAERRAIEQTTLAEAEAEAEAALGRAEKSAVVVTAGEGWHPGVVGLVAARLKERFGRPAFAIAFGVDGVGTGSGRSIVGADLGHAVREAVAEGLLLKGGGHAMAAGITVRRDRLAAFRAFVESRLGPAVEIARRNDALAIDGALAAAAATGELVTLVNRAGPYGSGNAEPVFALPGHTIAYAEEVAGGHVRVRLRARDGATIQGVAFRAVGQPLGRALLEHRGRPAHVAGSLAIDRWQGAERVSIRICDLAPAAN
ncbi:MAG: single-stranded-DNA-specific exonuclease RecJ [Variibacter sp.]|nr:single-stranded-DNA-specific exonuclease RecJ [Variibacter sp.]